MGRATSSCLSALVLVALAAGPSAARAKAAPRRAIDLDKEWRFLRSDAPGAEKPDFDDRKWTRVNVPHTWNAQDGQDGGGDYYRGVGWYRRRVSIPRAEAGRELYVEFDGANLESTLFVNGHEVGHHAGGYARFRFDVTSVAKPGAVNVLAVKVSNAENLAVPPRAAAAAQAGHQRVRRRGEPFNPHLSLIHI